jgi:hypothetical protein
MSEHSPALVGDLPREPASLESGVFARSRDALKDRGFPLHKNRTTRVQVRFTGNTGSPQRREGNVRTDSPALADELRDGLLQDLLASSLLLEHARRSLPIDGDPESEALLAAAAAALHEDIERVRRLIARLHGHEAA